MKQVSRQRISQLCPWARDRPLRSNIVLAQPPSHRQFSFDHFQTSPKWIWLSYLHLLSSSFHSHSLLPSACSWPLTMCLQSWLGSRGSLLLRPLLYIALCRTVEVSLGLALPQRMHFVTPSLSKARVDVPMLDLSHPPSSGPTCFNKCPLLNSSHFIIFCFGCFPLLDLGRYIPSTPFQLGMVLPFTCGGLTVTACS